MCSRFTPGLLDSQAPIVSGRPEVPWRPLPASPTAPGPDRDCSGAWAEPGSMRTASENSVKASATRPRTRQDHSKLVVGRGRLRLESEGSAELFDRLVEPPLRLQSGCQARARRTGPRRFELEGPAEVSFRIGRLPLVGAGRGRGSREAPGSPASRATRGWTARDGLVRVVLEREGQIPGSRSRMARQGSSRTA